MPLRFATNSIARFSSIVSMGLASVTVDGENKALIFNNSGKLGSSSGSAFLGTRGGVEYISLGNQPTVLDDIGFTGSQPPVLVVGQEISHDDINYNTFLDVTTITPTNSGAGFCSYSGSVRIANTAFNLNHVSWGQDFMIYNGSGTITDIWTMRSGPTINSGTVSIRKAYRVSDFGGAGAVTTQYAFHAESMTKAGTNWAAYMAGVTKNYFGGNVLFGTAGTPAAAVAPVTVNVNAAAPLAVVSPSVVIQATNVDGTGTQIELNSFGTAAVPALRTRAARGTKASPTALQSGDVLLAWGGAGYGATAFGSFDVAIQVEALENFTDTARGTAIDWYTNSAGAATLTRRMRAATGLMVGNTTDRGAGTINVTNSLFLGSFTVATLPAGVAAGQTAYASNCRVFNGAGTQEGGGAGTGGTVAYNGTAWKIAGTNITAVA